MLVWDLLSAEDIGKLYAYQMKYFGLKMKDPRVPVPAVVQTGELEQTEEIERLMAQAPSRSRGG